MTCRLTDTHCHLDMPELYNRLPDVLKNASESGVDTLITIGTDMGSSGMAARLALEHEQVYASVAVHPHNAKDFTDADYMALRGLCCEKKVVAVGETGLDYHYANSPREIQQEVFKRHIALSREAGLPLIIHSREARKDTLSILSGAGFIRGVMHCFSGDMEMAEAAMAMGLYISLAGPVTFKKKSLAAKEIAARIPDEYLLIETDSPYLAPEPLRGRTNEPAYLVHTAREIASLRGISVEDLARITTLNAARLFSLPGEKTAGPVIVYRIRESLYLNITNRCSNACTFCIRFLGDYVKGHNLRLAEEPTAGQLEEAIEKSRPGYKEIVFCGYGEPTMRLELLKEVAGWVKQRGGRVRLDTNGQGSLVNGRDILPELRGLIDSVSVSLDAQDAATYERLCRPFYPGAFEAVLKFIKEAGKYIPEVRATVVETPGVDIEKCAALARDLGLPGVSVRKLDVVG